MRVEVPIRSRRTEIGNDGRLPEDGNYHCVPESLAFAKLGDGTRGLYVDPSCVNTIAEYGTYAYATSDGCKRDPSEEPVKQSDHCLDATRYALHTELGEHAATEAYLAEMQRYVGM